MRLTDAVMYERFKAADPAYDGRFFTGVATTGVYCVPSCHARKPRRENVRFFPSCAAAQAAGFRACRKCHPEDFARGVDPLLDTVERVVQELYADPAAFADARAVVRRSGFGTTRAFELFRLHYHSTPADLLARARRRFVQRELLTTEAPLAEVAASAGYEALSTLHAAFREFAGMSPVAYRGLRAARSFSLTLPEGYPLPYLYRALARDPQSVNERLEGNQYAAGVRIGATAAVLRMEFAVSGDVSVQWKEASGPAIAAADVHRVVVGILGLEQDAAAFARLARRLGFARLVEGRPALRVVQTPSVYDGLVWAIVGQQINLPFAFALKRRLFERAGAPVAEGLIAPPSPAAVATLGPETLRSMQFSRQKAEYLLDASRQIASGKLDLEALREMSVTRAERTLLALRGLGPWSAHYVLMRALGHADCVPLGDTGVTSGLKELFALEKRPDLDDTRRLMAVFSPYRSLATNHLWQLLQSPP